ncbi:hypothetical protein BIT17_2702 [Mycobacterium tuberculosis variant bovis]|nr:hypothetical protein BIT17_2702 [Mycobacterium tuberculosis variant bovis]
MSKYLTSPGGAKDHPMNVNTFDISDPQIDHRSTGHRRPPRSHLENVAGSHEQFRSKNSQKCIRATRQWRKTAPVAVCAS